MANKTTLYFVLFKPECLTIGMECARVMAVSRRSLGNTIFGIVK